MTIESPCRKPGRPRGSSRYSESDPQLVRQIGDRLLAKPSLSVRAAIMQAVGDDNPAALRRLQGKCPSKARMIADAEERVREAQRRRAEAWERLHAVATAANASIAALVTSPGMRALSETMEKLARATAAFRIPALDQINELHRRLRFPEPLEKMMELQRRFQSGSF